MGPNRNDMIQVTMADLRRARAGQPRNLETGPILRSKWGFGDPEVFIEGLCFLHSGDFKRMERVCCDSFHMLKAFNSLQRISPLKIPPQL